MAKLEGCLGMNVYQGSSRLVSVGYGILELPVQCVVEDNKLGAEVLEEQITAFEGVSAAMDGADFNKV